VKFVRSVFSTVLATLGAGVLIGGIAVGAFAFSIYLIERAWPSSSEARIIGPREPSLAANFLQNPMSVLVCWTAYDADATYDMRVHRWDFGSVHTEVLHEISLVPCGGKFGTTHFFSADNLYHLELRACVGRTCSDWVPVTQGANHWLQVPCASGGEGCYHANEGGDAQAVR
jgi:hypothetical protein